MSIRIHIERLVVRGIPLSPRARTVFVAALQDELGRLVTEGELSPVLQEGAALPRVSAPDISLTARSSPAHLGREVARAVYAGLGDIDRRGEPR